MKTDITTVDEYIKSFPSDIHKKEHTRILVESDGPNER